MFLFSMFSISFGACALSIDSDNISWAYLLEAAHNNYMYGYSARYLLTQTERMVAVAVC